MTETTYFKNPSGPTRRSSKESSSSEPPRGSGTSSSTVENAGKKITGLVKDGGAVIGGQVAAQVATDLTMKAVGSRLPEIAQKAVAVAGPIALGAALMAVSKKKHVQYAGIGCVAAGVSKGVSMLIGDTEYGKYLPFADGQEPRYVDYTDVTHEMLEQAQRDFAALNAAPADRPVEIVDLSSLQTY